MAERRFNRRLGRHLMVMSIGGTTKECARQRHYCAEEIPIGVLKMMRHEMQAQMSIIMGEMFISSDSRRKGTKEDCYPQAPYIGDVADYAGDPLRQSFGMIHEACALRVNHIVSDGWRGDGRKRGKGTRLRCREKGGLMMAA